jgi:type II secretory ATPase GspE/PulE/Tfp pilus assembly ATPase PilB-like protein
MQVDGGRVSAARLRDPRAPRGYRSVRAIRCTGASMLRAPEPATPSTFLGAPGTAEARCCAVTVGLVDGSTHAGTIAAFSPQQVDLPLTDARGVQQLIATERVAYVAYHRHPKRRVVEPEGADVYKIHVVGRQVFRVCAKLSAGSRGARELGFTATPADADGSFDELFFYHHGVVAKELDEPIGEMLVREGVLAPAALAQALAAQSAQRVVPIGQILVEHRKVAPDDVARAAEQQQRRKLRIGEVLIDAGLVSQADVDAALLEQRLRKGKRLGEVLVDLGLLTEETLARTLSNKFRVAFVDLDACTLNPEALREVPVELIEKYGVLPVDMDAKSLTIAIADPLALDVLDVLRFQTKRRVDDVLVTPTQLKRHVAAYLAKVKKEREAPPSDFRTILKELAATDGALIEADAEERDPGQEDRGIVSLVNKIIFDAYRRGASDIHVEPNGKERSLQVRLRVDGDCTPYEEIPAAHRSAVVARIKIMAGLDIAERRRPQDGKIKFKIGESQIELRVATIPTVGGTEDVVLRILAASTPRPLDKMGLSKRNLEALHGVIHQPYGLVLCVGPTGSGKTTTLHSALGAINTPDMKIWTAEDPVEITQPGLRQVQVHAKIGFTFAQAMRAFLRADPDVIMVGEMRDEETASTAVEASLTGHLVFSTLHTNSAPETITRLLDMGLDPFTFGDALLGILAQRLARALCTACRVVRAGTEAEYAALDGAFGEGRLARDLGLERGPAFHVWHAVGCDACGGSGYKGRVALHELLVSDDPTRMLIARKAPVEELRRQAIQGGMRTLLQDGIEKCLAGQTDLKQVFTVCSR